MRGLPYGAKPPHSENHTLVSVAIGRSLSELRYLGILNIARTRVTGNGLEMLETLPSLSHISLAAPQLDQTELENLAACHQPQSIPVTDATDGRCRNTSRNNPADIGKLNGSISSGETLPET